MKKLLCILLSFLLLAGCSSAPKEDKTTESQDETSSALNPGTYNGTATGFHGEVTVEVVVDETSLVSVSVVDHVETRFISDNAINQLPLDMVKNQSINLDAYSGATVSSNAVLNAVRNALSEAGDISSLEKKVATQEVTEQTIDSDVVVIGGGIAGLAAAMSAVENGATVTLVEKLDRVGGSTVLSGGILYTTGSDINKDVDNDVQALVDYWQARAEGNADEAMLQIAAQESAKTVSKLQEWGVIFASTPGVAGTSPALRAIYASNKEANDAATDGVDFIVPVLEAAKNAGVNIITGTQATELLTQDNTVVGIKATSDSVNYTINAKSVVIATGGYDLSSEMMEAHSPDLAGTWAISSPGNTGDGIKLAESVNAQTNYTGGVIGFKIIDKTKHYIEGSNLLGWMGLLGVTNEGVRFGNESADYPIFCTELIEARKAGATATYLILDSSSTDLAALAEMAVDQHLGFKADSLEELATTAGINAENLEKTVADYNATVGTGVADEFGKVNNFPVSTGSFYAVKIEPATLGTIGGLVISENAEVLDTNNNPISGLYAAGEVANSQFLYKEYPASGSSISISTSFGRIAGTSAANNAK